MRSTQSNTVWSSISEAERVDTIAEFFVEVFYIDR